MSNFWQDREKMRARTEKIRASQPDNPTAPPDGPGTPAAEHRKAQDELTAECDRAVKNHPGVGMGGNK